MRFENILDAVGNTPLVKLPRIGRKLACPIYAKLEFMNPGGSVKDRVARSIAAGAEARGELVPGGTLVECTSGNTGMGLAMFASARGYKAVFTMDDKQSREKVNTLKAMGAEVIICPAGVARDDPRHYIQVAQKLAREIPNSYLANQYDNPDTVQAHYRGTGPEIFADTDGRITHFVAGVGTCGTIMGVGKYLKEKNPKIKVIGVDPEGSVYYDFFHRAKVVPPRVYKVEGIGEDFFPKILNWEVIDDIVQIPDKESLLTARKLARIEGVFAGGSSGAAVAAAIRVARDLGPESLVVALVPDGGRQYLGKVYNDDWMKENQFIETEISLTVFDILKHKKIKELKCVEPSETALVALKKMRGLDASQLPVLEGGAVAGTLYEDDVVSVVLAGKDLSGVIVREIMREALPIVRKEATLEEITAFIPVRSPAVLVDLGQGRYDIITKFDLVTTVGAYAEGKL